jgi:AraC family transcriptional regulator
LGHAAVAGPAENAAIMSRAARRSITATPARHAELIGRALALIDARLDEALTADRLADAAAMSRHHFHRVFQAHLGCSVGSYLAWRRLQRACALLASGREPVLEVALAVGYDSAQALAKAMRRELDTTPTAVRRGAANPWKNLLPAWRLPVPPVPEEGDPAMQPSRFADLPPGLQALTTTGRGMVDRTMMRAARQAFGELAPAVTAAGAMDRARSCLAIMPDDAQGPDDPHCRYIAGLVFGYRMADGSGRCELPAVPLSGTLAWWPLAAGRYAVFTHAGPYDGLHACWRAIYRDWLPSSGQQLRDNPPMELMLNDPQDTPPAKLLTEIWIPLQ